MMGVDWIDPAVNREMQRLPCPAEGLGASQERSVAVS